MNKIVHRTRDATLGKVLRAHPDFVSVSQTALDLQRPLSEVSRELNGWVRPSAKHRREWAAYLGMQEEQLFPEGGSIQ